MAQALQHDQTALIAELPATGTANINEANELAFRTIIARQRTKPVGTGPYKFVRWAKGDRIELQRNDGYWGGKPEFGLVTIKFVTDAAARVPPALRGQKVYFEVASAPGALSVRVNIATSGAKFDSVTLRRAPAAMPATARRPWWLTPAMRRPSCTSCRRAACSAPATKAPP